MSKFKCDNCNKKFEMNYFKWILSSPLHMFKKRFTKCPYCGVKSWIKRVK